MQVQCARTHSRALLAGHTIQRRLLCRGAAIHDVNVDTARSARNKPVNLHGCVHLQDRQSVHKRSQAHRLAIANAMVCM